MLPLVVWQAPAPCPDAATVEARLGAALGDLPDGWDPESEVRGHIERGTAAEWVLELEMVERGPADAAAATRRRRLTATDCDELTDAAIVAVALALGDAAAEHQRSALAAASAAEAPAGVVDTRSLGPEPALPRERPSSLALGAGAVADSGSLPGWGWGATLGVHGRYGAWGVDLYGVWLPERSNSIAEGQGVDFGLLGGGLRGCYRALDGMLGVDGCLGLELDSLSASAYGLAEGQERSDLLFAPLASLALSWRMLEHSSLLARLDGLAPLPQQQYSVNIGEQVHETPAVVVRLSLGVEVDLLWR